MWQILKFLTFREERTRMTMTLFYDSEYLKVQQNVEPLFLYQKLKLEKDSNKILFKIWRLSLAQIAF